MRAKEAKKEWLLLAGPITVYLREFLAPIERTLWPRKGAEGIEQLRDDMMKEIGPPIRIVMETETNNILKEVYYDWSLQEQEPANGMIWGVMDTGENHKERFPWPQEINHGVFEQKIARLHNQIDQAPEELRMYWVGENELVIEKVKLLLQIERELIQNWHGEILKTRKRRVDKELFTKKILQVFLQRKVNDVFIDWNLQEDKAYMVICLQKEPRNKEIETSEPRV